MLTHPPLSARMMVVLAMLAALVWFGNLDYRKLIKTDEGRYGEIAREMVADNDWVTPRLNGFKYFYKPPLQYWATALAYKAFGVDEWTTRLWTALTGFGAALFTGLAAGVLWGRAAGVMATAIVLGSVYWVGMGHLAALDMGLAAFLSSAISACALGLRDGISLGRRRTWMLVAWGCAALAVMSKGLIGAVLPAGAIGLYILWERDWRLLARLHWWSGLLVFGAITVPWFVLVSRANPEFAEFFFIREHFTRFLTKEHGRYGPWWYFIPYVLVGMMPFTLGLYTAVRIGMHRERTGFQPQRLLLAWVVLVFLFFSASSSKLPSYMLPIVPAIAMLMARGLARAAPRGIIAHWLLALAFGAIVFVGGLFARFGARHEDVAALINQYQPWILAAGVVLTVGALAGIVLARRMRIVASTIVIGASGLVGAQLAASGHEALAPVYSSYDMAQRMTPRLRPDTALFVVDTFDHTLPFYLERTLTMVAYKDELAAAIAWEPEKFIPDFDAFERAWRDAPHALALMAPSAYQHFLTRGLPMVVLVQDRRRIVVEKID